MDGEIDAEGETEGLIEGEILGLLEGLKDAPCTAKVIKKPIQPLLVELLMVAVKFPVAPLSVQTRYVPTTSVRLPTSAEASAIVSEEPHFSELKVRVVE